jgi:hypothetical protein
VTEKYEFIDAKHAASEQAAELPVVARMCAFDAGVQVGLLRVEIPASKRHPSGPGFLRTTDRSPQTSSARAWWR